jgi:MFS transporter, ACS family, hexuronate transporter
MIINSSEELVKPVSPARGTDARLRWAVAALLLLASVMNYVDRQTLSILARTIQTDLGIDDAGYARVVQAFQLTYMVMYLLSGRVVDAVGARLAMAGFIAWWSAANMLTGLAGGLLSLAFFRALLGVGEPGGYTASAKAVAEWFPAREKGVAVGMYTMGGTLGAAVAAPALAFIALGYGWRMAFVVTGAAGLLLAAVWLVVYRRPAVHPWLGAAEREMLTREGVINAGDAAAARRKGIEWKALLKLKPMWVVLAARMLTDPLWYFYLFWFPKYLQDARGFTLKEIGQTVWIIFVAADLGCVLGGWMSGRYARRGVEPVRARLRVMAGAAAVLAFSLALPVAAGRAWPIALASLFAFAQMAWLTSATTLSVDIFPTSVVGSAHGAIGAGSALGGLISSGIVGWLVTHYSYTPVFVLMSCLHPLAFALVYSRLPKLAADYRRGLGGAA